MAIAIWGDLAETIFRSWTWQGLFSFPCFCHYSKHFYATQPEQLGVISSALKQKGAKISQMYKRLDPLKPAYTLTASGGGGTHVYHWSEPRALTNRERARLQTFPDSFRFFGGKESVRKQIGMAVPCKGAQIIFEAILESFENYSCIIT